ncbi:MAG: RAD55 family ATPase [Candidatus Thermoplasmatota archaeon]
MNFVPKASTGIQDLDAMLGGGIVPGTFCILDGDPMSAVHHLALEYARHGLRSGEGCVYLCTKEFGENILQEIMLGGVPQVGLLSIIDAYTALADPDVTDTDAIQYVSSVSDLPKLTHVVVQAMSKLYTAGVMQQRMVIESVDTLKMYLSIQAIYRFLFFIKAKVKAFKGTALVVFSTDLCPEQDRRVLLELADIVIRMESATSSVRVMIPSKVPTTGKYSANSGALTIMPTGVTAR